MHYNRLLEDAPNNKPPVPTVEMGTDNPIVLDKMFGPTIFARIRITAELERGGWVIERCMDRGWVEVCILPAQVDADFPTNSD